MEAFRALIRGWLGKTLLVIFMVPFALVGIEGYFAGNPNGEPVAEVGDQAILEAELSQAVARQRQQLLEQVNGDASRIDDAKLREQVLDGLVNRAALLQQAQGLGFEMSTAQISEMIRKEPNFQDNGQFSENLFQTFLRSSGQTSSGLIDSIRQQAAIQQLAGGLNDSGFSNGKELDRLAMLQSEKRDIHLASLPLAPYLAQAQVSDAQIAQYYSKNKAALVTSTSIDLDYITLDQSQFAAQAQTKVTADDIAKRYQDLIKASSGNAERQAQHILIAVDDKTNDAAAKKQANELAARIQKGEDFAALAKQYSKDPGSAVNGGDLGFASKGTYVPEFEATLDNLKINQVSAPVKTQFGYHIIKLLQTRQPAVQTLEQARPQLQAEAEKAKADELYSDAISALNEMAVESGSLAELAKAYQLTVQTVPAFTQVGQAGDLQNPELLKTAFSEGVTQDKQVSSAISILPTRNIWLQARNFKPTRPKTLAEAAPEIKGRLQAEQALKLARQQADKISAAINQGASLEAVQTQFAVTFNALGSMGRMNGLPDPRLQSLAFSIATPPANQLRAGTMGTENVGATIIAVNNVVAGTASSMPAEQRTQMSKMLASLHGQQEVQDYIEYLKGKTKIERKPLAKPEADPAS